LGAEVAASQVVASDKVERRATKKQRYHLSRLQDLLDRNQHRQAERVLDAVWRQEDGQLNPDRLCWLILHWPERVERDIAEVPASGWSHPVVVDALASTILLLPGEALAALDGVHSAALEDARLVRRASTLIAAAQDQEALALLRGIGLRSPFRESRIFLRGLSAFYRFEDQEATRALEALGGSQPYGALAHDLLSLMPAQEGAQEDSLSHGAHFDALLNALGREEQSGHVRLARVRKPLSDGKLNTALREATRPGLDPTSVLFQALRRDLAAALLSGGLLPEDVCERIDRAFAEDPEDPGMNRLRALMFEAAGLSHRAIHHWLHHARELWQGAGSFSPGERTLALAALYHRLGTLQTGLAVDDDEKQRCSPFGLFSRRQLPPSHLWEHAFQWFSKAVELDAESLEHWQGLLTVAEHLRDKPQRNRVLERFVKQFPDHPEALVAAARAAGERKACDKGLRYARRAAELEPLNRNTRDLETWLLLVKARKKFHQGKTAQARSVYQEALAVPNRTPTSMFKAFAEAAAFEEARGKTAEVLALRSDLLAHNPQPWIWTGYFLIGREHLKKLRGRGSRTRRAMETGAAPPETAVLSLLPRPPEAGEVSELLQLAESFRHQFQWLTPELTSLVERAVAGGGTLLGERTELERALDFAKGEILLKLAEHGQRLFPDSKRFAVTRYQTAMDCGLEAQYFAGAEEELGRLSTTRATARPAGEGPELDDNEPAGWDGDEEDDWDGDDEDDLLLDPASLISHLLGQEPADILDLLRGQIRRYTEGAAGQQQSRSRQSSGQQSRDQPRSSGQQQLPIFAGPADEES